MGVGKHLAIGAIIVVASLATAAQEDPIDVDTFDGGTLDDPGGLDVDRDYVWVNGTADGGSFAHSFAAAVYDGDITCYELGGTPHSDGNRSEVNSFYSCNDEYALQTPDPQIALLGPSVQRSPPCDREGLCQSASFLVPVFGDWRGRIEVDVHKEGTLVDSHVLDFPRKGYGAVDGQILTDLDSNYSVEVRVYTNITGLNPEFENATSDSIGVVDASAEYWIQGAEYVEAPGGDTSDHLYIASGQVDPRDDVCMRLLDGDGNVLNTIEAPNVDHVRLPGGTNQVPSTVKLGPSCSNIVTESSVSKVSYGS